MPRTCMFNAANRAQCKSAAACLLVSLLLATMLPAQAPSDAGTSPAAQNTSPQGGISAGAPQKAEYDSEHRPITAGGFVKTGPVIFLDTAEKAGLTTWHHTAGTPEKRFIL
jgi:enediyne biosynthesis protein E4